MPELNVRDKILAAGLETMYRLGFNGCSVQDITNAAGVPKGSFYNHFKSKEMLGVEIVNLYSRQTATNLMILSDTSISPLKRLTRYFEVLSQDLADFNYERGCLVGNFSAELSDQSNLVRQQVSRALEAWVKALSDCLRLAQIAGEIRTDIDTSILASFLANAWEGTVLRSKVERNGNAVEQFKAIIFSFLL